MIFCVHASVYLSVYQTIKEFVLKINLLPFVIMQKIESLKKFESYKLWKLDDTSDLLNNFIEMDEISNILTHV